MGLTIRSIEGSDRLGGGAGMNQCIGTLYFKVALSL